MNSNDPHETGDRRRLLVATGRWALLGGLGLLAGGLSLRPRNGAGGDCPRLGACAACDCRADCTRPQAIASRERPRN